MTPTAEQQAIHLCGRTTKGDILVKALAGTGKTTTVIAMLGQIPQRSILLCAFNRRIEEELAARVLEANIAPSQVVHVRTFHSQGLAILRKHFRGRSVDKSATEGLIGRAADEGGGLAFKLRRIAVHLLRQVKEVTFVQPDELTEEQIVVIGHARNGFADGKDVLPELQIAQIASVVRAAYRLSTRFEERTTVDFCDMVWGPLVRKLAPPSRYQAVVVDELQDISAPQLAMLQTLVAPGGRFIGIGDPNQAIYDWRGAVPDKVWALFTERKAVTLPLTVSFRCSRAVVREANRLVPALRALPGAPVGSVTTLATPNEILAPLRGTEIETFVLSRTNKELLTMALFLWRHEVAFRLNAGEDMLDPLFDVLRNLTTVSTQAVFLASLTTWYTAESKRAEAANATAWAERLDEQYQMLTVASAYAAPNRIADLLHDMIRFDGAHVTLSTVHKVKGLEAVRVFLLKQTFAAHRPPRRFPSGDPMPTEPPNQEELNIEYVAITRAKLDLVWVNVTT